MTQQGDMLGTPQYMAPEQIKGEAIDGRTDVYALGCMLYEMLTGRMPFEAATIMAMLSKHLIEAPIAPSQRRPDLGLTPALDQLVLGAMAKEAARRPPTMEQYGEQIAALAATLPPVEPSRSRPQSVAPPISVVTPAAPSAVAAPAAWTPPPIPPTTRANPSTTPPPPIAAKKNRAWLFAIAGVLVLGGAAAVYFGTRTPATDPGPGSAVTPDPTRPDPWNNQAPPADAAVGPDPWNASKPAPVQHEVDVGTSETPVPAGAKLIVPSGWTYMKPTPTTVGYLDGSTGVFVAIGPLGAGTNDPKALAMQWATATGAQFKGLEKIVSAGKSRDVAGFTATINGVPMVQLIAMYPTKRYRVGVMYQAPEAMAGEPGFEERVRSFFANSVKLP
jgi:serine/threonine-protein kinase